MDVKPAEAFRLLLRADYPQELGLADEITSYEWFAHRGHRLFERSDSHDAIVLRVAKNAIKKLREKVRDGSIGLTGTIDPKIPPALIGQPE
jgi:hypothetical protein